MTMFERVVSQVILGYLGRYFKDIQKHQLKITLWNGEVFLENVELSLEAFDYLQLSFALKEGRVGKLSIKIPWKKLGWDLIEIILEAVFLCASQRDDQGWSLDEVERRELAWKKAKLAAAELGKLSKHVSENQAGLISYISAKRLRIYQQRCETFETIVHSNTSCPYAWDEPCYPHRVIVEVPGKRVLVSYPLDDVKEYSPCNYHHLLRFQSRVLPLSDPFLHSRINDAGLMDSYATEKQLHLMTAPVSSESHKPRLSLPSIVPIGASWQQIYLLARRQKKIYVEVFDFGPINLTLSFSSAPWMLRNRILTAGESVIHRGLMALADVEGARIHLKQLTITHQIASLESLQEILVRHYTRQLLHEMYKVFGSAGVIGNSLGFTRSMGLGTIDFLSVPARSIFLSPTGLITGMAQGTTSLLSNTVYAISDAATQFSKAAHKGIVAFTFDDQAVSEVEQQQSGIGTHSKGVISGVFEELTGLLQSPIKGTEKHGLPGVLSGIALGITGLVAQRAASILESILEVTGKTAESIRNWSRLYQMGQQRFRVRLPRPLSRELPVRPYSWEDAVGTSVLVTQRLVLIVSCSNLVDLGKPEFLLTFTGKLNQKSVWRVLYMLTVMKE